MLLNDYRENIGQRWDISKKKYMKRKRRIIEINTKTITMIANIVAMLTISLIYKKNQPSQCEWVFKDRVYS